MSKKSASKTSSSQQQQQQQQQSTKYATSDAHSKTTGEQMTQQQQQQASQTPNGNQNGDQPPAGQVIGAPNKRARLTGGQQQPNKPPSANRTTNQTDHDDHDHDHHHQRQGHTGDPDGLTHKLTNSAATTATTAQVDSPKHEQRQQQQQLNICAACSRPIRERYLLVALDKKWHEDCLKCACCDCRLGEVGSSLFTHSGKILCRRDFLRIFGQHGLCAACKRSIPPYELVMRANQNAYHMDCFACQSCQYRFCVGDRFHLTEAHRIVCLDCYQDQQQQQQQQLQLAPSDQHHQHQHLQSQLNYALDSSQQTPPTTGHPPRPPAPAEAEAGAAAAAGSLAPAAANTEAAAETADAERTPRFVSLDGGSDHSQGQQQPQRRRRGARDGRSREDIHHKQPGGVQRAEPQPPQPPPPSPAPEANCGSHLRASWLGRERS